MGIDKIYSLTSYREPAEIIYYSKYESRDLTICNLECIMVVAL